MPYWILTAVPYGPRNTTTWKLWLILTIHGSTPTRWLSRLSRSVASPSISMNLIDAYKGDQKVLNQLINPHRWKSCNDLSAQQFWGWEPEPSAAVGEDTTSGRELGNIRLERIKGTLPSSVDDSRGGGRRRRGEGARELPMWFNWGCEEETP